MKVFLLPIAKLYEAGVRLRNWLYLKGWFRVHRLKQPVISVGNLTMGGTGKTPTVIALGQFLQKGGYSISILLRGYKGQNHGGPVLVSDGKAILTNSEVAGDEALVIARNLPGAFVVVAKDRARAGTWVEARYPLDAHLLDDGFQHLKLHRDLNLLLIDVANPFGGENLPPLGRLREPLDGISRSDAVIFSRTQSGQNYQGLIDRVRSYKPGVPCFMVKQRLASAAAFCQGKSSAVSSLQGMRALAFAGIANPSQFFDALQEWGVHVIYKMGFPDHHHYTLRDLNRIRKKCLELGIEAAITTEKDAENFEAAQLAPLEVIVVKVAFEFDDLEKLRQMLLDKMPMVAR